MSWIQRCLLSYMRHFRWMDWMDLRVAGWSKPDSPRSHRPDLAAKQQSTKPCRGSCHCLLQSQPQWSCSRWSAGHLVGKARQNAICTSLIPWDPNLWGSACHVHGLGSWELRGALTHLRHKKGKSLTWRKDRKRSRVGAASLFFFFF